MKLPNAEQTAARLKRVFAEHRSGLPAEPWSLALTGVADRLVDLDRELAELGIKLVRVQVDGALPDVSQVMVPSGSVELRRIPHEETLSRAWGLR